jgi:hypothetical protein
MNFLMNLERALCVKFVGFFVFCSDLVHLLGNLNNDYENLSYYSANPFLYVEGKVQFLPMLN